MQFKTHNCRQNGIYKLRTRSVSNTLLFLSVTILLQSNLAFSFLQASCCDNTPKPQGRHVYGFVIYSRFRLKIKILQREETWKKKIRYLFQEREIEPLPTSSSICFISSEDYNIYISPSLLSGKRCRSLLKIIS